MNAKTEGRIFGCFAIGLTLFGAVAPYRWKKMPPVISDICLIIAGIFAIIALCLLIPYKWKRTIFLPVKRIKRMWIIIIMVISGFLFIYCFIALHQKSLIKDSWNIQSMSNEELKEFTFNLTKEMRDMQTYWDKKREEILNPRMPPNLTKEQQDECQKEMKMKQDQLPKEIYDKYRSTLWSPAKSLRNELCYRLRISPPETALHESVAIDVGLLAGVSPLNNSANYLDDLARRLPSN